MNQRSILKRTVKPASYPVSLDDAKEDLRVQHTAEDALIDGLIAAATDYMDAPNGAIGKALMTQTWTLSVPHTDRWLRIYLPITPVQSIESITYFDADNVEQSLTVSGFHLYADDEDFAWIEPKSGVDWPQTFSRMDAITVTFIAGFGPSLFDVPDTIRHAIRLMVVHWYENRSAVVLGTTVEDLPMAVQSLINMNRKGWVA